MTGATRESTTAVIGVGNEIMSDDGVGVHAVRRLMDMDLPGIDIWEAGTRALHAADIARNYHRIILIDAMEGGEAPGTVYRVEQPAGQETLGPMSLHSLDVLSGMQLAGEGAPDAVLFGVEPERIDYGTELSRSVNEALPELCECVVNAAREGAASMECVA